MRRALFTGVLPIITALAALATASPALAREPEPVTITPFTLPAGVICESFAVDVGVISNHEHQETTTLGDHPERQRPDDDNCPSRRHGYGNLYLSHYNTEIRRTSHSVANCAPLR